MVAKRFPLHPSNSHGSVADGVGFGFTGAMVDDLGPVLGWGGLIRKGGV